MMHSFANSYAEARQKFIAAAENLGLNIQHVIHPMRGPQEEQLATDVVVLGDPKAQRALYVSSGVHGLEGYYGSAVLVQWLQDNWTPPIGVKVILVHACNPHGFAWGRRVTEENVDLNRNFWPLDQSPVHNQAYEEIQTLVEYPGATPDIFARSQQERTNYLETHGSAGFKIALSGGQQQSPQGLFYAGTQPTWARITYENLVQEHTNGCAQVFFLDLHTGLGPCGYADFLHQYTHDSKQLATLVHYIGERVLGDERDAATAQGLEGTTIACFKRHAKSMGYTVLGGVVECGTTPLDQTLEALLQEAALHRHGCSDSVLSAQIRQQLKDCFYVNETHWKQSVVSQTTEIRQGAINYLINQ